MTMNILIIGAFGHNGSRLKQFHKRGCRLTYLSTFYFVESLWDFQDNTLTYEHFQDQDELYRDQNFEHRVIELIERDSIDIIYCILNFMDGSNEFTKRLIDMRLPIPVIRHYEEHQCRYDELENYVLLNSDAQIYENIESYYYFKNQYNVGDNYIIALGDPPQYETYLPEKKVQKISESDNEIHVASFAGLNLCRDLGPDNGRYAIEEITEVIIKAGIHLHLFGNLSPKCSDVYDDLRLRYPKHLHIHGFTDSKTSCAIASQYDWGLIYCHRQELWKGLEDQEIHFNRLNSTGKMAHYIAAQVPFFMKRGIYDFMERILIENSFGFIFDDYEELIEKLKDRNSLNFYKKNLELYSYRFSMEAQADKILNFFNKVISLKRISYSNV